MRRFVVIATMRRGAVLPSEPLDEDGQAAAFAGLERDEDCLVVWRRVPGYSVLREVVSLGKRHPAQDSGERMGHVTRMVRLAEKVRVA